MKQIKLTKDKIAIVDDEDYKYLMQWEWYAFKTGNHWYAARSNNPGIVLMHREIVKTPEGLMTDHINHNGLDNRRENLRICTNQQNQWNQKLKGMSSYKGVVWNKNAKKWYARIKKFGKIIHIGTFLDEEEAARAYDGKAKELFGKFANLNFKN